VSASLHQTFLDTISGTRRGAAASAARLALRAAEPGFAVAAALRGALYDRQILPTHAAPRPVVSVGNITTGGTGKTPIVQWLASALAQRGRHPAILLRGYKSTAAGSDEGELLRQRLAPSPGTHSLSIPVITQPDRVAAAQALARTTPQIDLFILDDGFQHRRLRRDFDLVLIDATQPFGFGHLLPRGLLRERPSALARADAILLTRCDQVVIRHLETMTDDLRQFAPGVPIFASEFVPDGWIGDGASPPAALSGPCLAVCGIGNPAAFERSARDAGADVVKLLKLDDHHQYTTDDLGSIAAECRRINAGAVVTTEKDWVKLMPLLAETGHAGGIELPPFRALRIVPRFPGDSEPHLLERILAATARAPETAFP
jgi:tetraacyldisaccharide 4'-kinase